MVKALLGSIQPVDAIIFFYALNVSSTLLFGKTSSSCSNHKMSALFFTKSWKACVLTKSKGWWVGEVSGISLYTASSKGLLHIPWTLSLRPFSLSLFDLLFFKRLYMFIQGVIVFILLRFHFLIFLILLSSWKYWKPSVRGPCSTWATSLVHGIVFCNVLQYSFS